MKQSWGKHKIEIINQSNTNTHQTEAAVMRYFFRSVSQRWESWESWELGEFSIYSIETYIESSGFSLICVVDRFASDLWWRVVNKLVNYKLVRATCASSRSSHTFGRPAPLCSRMSFNLYLSRDDKINLHLYSSVSRRVVWCALLQFRNCVALALGALCGGDSSNRIIRSRFLVENG